MQPFVSWHTITSHAATCQGTGAIIPRPTTLPPSSSIAALLRRWSSHTFPGATLAATAATSGASTPVWRVEATWPDRRAELFYLRLGEEPGERRDGEVRIHQLLTAQGVPVPEVIAWEGAPPELDRAATLTRAIPGIPVQAIAPALPPDVLSAIAQTAGRDLARINALSVTGFGWIDLPDAVTGTLRAECPTRGAWLVEYDRELASVLENELMPHDYAPALCETYARWRDATTTAQTSNRASLAHGDFDASHIFCTLSNEDAVGGLPHHTYTGIIDFGEARGADSFYDLGHALLHDGEGGTPPIFPSLLAGYCAVLPMPENASNLIHAQAIAIGIRHLAIAHRRESPYADVLTARIVHLLDSTIDGQLLPSDRPPLG